MNTPKNPLREDSRSTRRSFLGGTMALGWTAALSGCVGGGADAPATGTPGDRGSPTGRSTRSNGAPSDYDCGSIPATLAPFDAVTAGFAFGFDAPEEPAHNVQVGESAVERVANFERERTVDGVAVLDYVIGVTQSIETYDEVDTDRYQDATEVEPLAYGGGELPVTHVQNTADHEMWVFGIPGDGGVHVVYVNSSVVPPFGCNDEVAGIAEEMLASVRPL